jgi:hypothetical protein
MSCGVLQCDQQLPSPHLPIPGNQTGPVSEKHRAWAGGRRLFRDTGRDPLHRQPCVGGEARADTSRSGDRGIRRQQCPPKCPLLPGQLPQSHQEQHVQGERHHIEAFRQPLRNTGEFRALDGESDEAAPSAGGLAHIRRQIPRR